MKKILLLVISIAMIGIVGCSSTDAEQEKSNEKPKKEEIVLSNEEQSKALETINFMCEGTAYEKATIKLKTEQQEEFTTTNNVLKVVVIKSEEEVLDYYKEKVPETDPKVSIEKSLTLDTAISAVSEKNDKINKFDKIVAVLYSSEEDLKNDKSYAADILNID